MKQLISALFLIAFIFGCAQHSIQSTLNLDFEKSENGRPVGWQFKSDTAYAVSLDSVNVKHGKYSMLIEHLKGDSGFCPLVFTLPHNYDGKKITLSGYIKTENVTDGFAGLWMRIDPKIAFDNMYRYGLKGTNEWEKYEITLDMDPGKTKKIVFGGLLKGKGKMWIDDLTVTIDGRDIENVALYKLSNFEKDTLFDHGSKVDTIKTDAATVKNLQLLGMVWGFVKYYHPNVAKGDVNWDYELFRTLPQILNTENNTTRDKYFVEWFDRLGAFEQANNKDDWSNAKIKPDLDWISTSNISNNLKERLLKLKDAKRSNEHFYISLAQGVQNPVFKNEKAYESMIFPDAGYRLLALYRYWNTIQYFFPYKNLIEEDWKNVLTSFIPKFINAKNETEYNLIVSELITTINDTHAWLDIWGENAALRKYFGERNAAPEIKFVENKAIVKGFYDENLGKQTTLQKGDIITAVNGKDVNKWVTDNLKITPASNYATKLRDLGPRLLKTNDTTLHISYLRDGIAQKQVLKTYTLKEMSTYTSLKDTCFKMITPEIGYLYLGSMKSNYLPAIFEKLKRTKGLIIDLRCYPGDMLTYTLSKYLLSQPTEFVKFSNGSLQHPGLFIFNQKKYNAGEYRVDYYRGKIVILVNEDTQSNAEFTAMALRVAPTAIVVGSTTAGADGNISEFSLPGGIKTRFSGIGVYYPDGTETQRTGIVPDIEIKPTIKGIKSGKDQVLGKAIDIINKHKFSMY